jgi:hypothetical protein
MADQRCSHSHTKSLNEPSVKEGLKLLAVRLHEGNKVVLGCHFLSLASFSILVQVIGAKGESVIKRPAQSKRAKKQL